MSHLLKATPTKVNEPYEYESMWFYQEKQEEYIRMEEKIFTNWYTFLEEHYPNDEIYSIIHNPDLSLEEEVEAENLFVIHKDNWLDRITDDFIQGLEKSMEDIDSIFDHNGYLVLSMEEAAEIVPKMQQIVQIVNKLGQTHLELL